MGGKEGAPTNPSPRERGSSLGTWGELLGSTKGWPEPAVRG